MVTLHLSDYLPVVSIFFSLSSMLLLVLPFDYGGMTTSMTRLQFCTGFGYQSVSISSWL
jgi:hypothetical protein